MNEFGLVVIGSHSGVWLTSFFEEYKNKNILLVEPVPYNVIQLKENTSKYENMKILKLKPRLSLVKERFKNFILLSMNLLKI